MAVEKFRWNTSQIYFGRSSLGSLSEIIAPAPASVLLITGASFARKSGLTDKIKQLLGNASVQVHEGVSSNPTAKDLPSLIGKIRENKFTHIIALGGGSVLDAAKASVAYPATADVSVSAIQAWIRKPFFSGSRGLKLVAIPSTAGTGSEVTSFATVWDFEESKKFSVENELLVPDFVILDSEITEHMPPAVALTTGLDAFGHAMESLWSRRNNSVSRALSFQALEILTKNLPLLKADRKNAAVLDQMLWGSLLSGMAISVSRTAAAHALSYGMTLKHGIDHGEAVAIFLPAVLKRNFKALSEETTQKLFAIFKANSAENLVEKVKAFICGHSAVGSTKINEALREQQQHISEILALERLQNNIVAYTQDDLTSLYQESLRN